MSINKFLEEVVDLKDTVPNLPVVSPRNYARDVLPVKGKDKDLGSHKDIGKLFINRRKGKLKSKQTKLFCLNSSLN